MSTPTGPVEGFPEPGERFGPYEIVRPLGMGGMGVVFEAVDTVLKRRVALKVIAPRLADDPAFRVRFTLEAQAQASFDSPHVVQVFAHGEADGSLYLATQLVPDGDLGAMIRAQGALPPRVALDLVAQVSAGLADAHAAGLVHRDIKPGNVLLRVRGEEVSAYLADFGIAGRADHDPGLDPTGLAVGTPSYLAPELHTGGRSAASTDVYSLGCLLWTALTGSAPYSGTDHQLANAHASAPIPQLAATGRFEREVNRVLRTAMAKHPGERYPSAAVLRDDLRRVLRTFPAPASARSLAGLAVAVVVALLVTGVLAAVALAGEEDAASTGASGLTRAERRAVDNIAAALAGEAGLDQVDADCTARTLVADSGIDGLQEQGVLDDDLNLTADTRPVAAFADVIAIGVSCVFDTVSSGG